MMNRKGRVVAGMVLSEDRFRKKRMNDESKKYFVIAIILVMVVALMGSFLFSKKKEPVPKPTPVPIVAKEMPKKPTPAPVIETKVVYEEYTIKKGEFIVKIAEERGISWEEILLANREALQERYSQKCNNLSAKYRSGKRRSGRRRKGHFCNDRLEQSWANTVLPGEVIKIPKEIKIAAPTKEEGIVVDAVKKIKGDKVAIVIDDTESMNDDRARVAVWYASAVRQMGKKLTGIYLYGDGFVSKISQNGEVRLGSVGGGMENTYAALKSAAAEHPDSIILVSDEVGDDWPSNEQDLKALPMVIAHCLPETRATGCTQSFTRLAQATNGTFVLGL